MGTRRPLVMGVTFDLHRAGADFGCGFDVYVVCSEYLPLPVCGCLYVSLYLRVSDCLCVCVCICV